MDSKKLAVVVAVAILTLGGGVAFAAQQREDPKVDRAAAEEAALGAVTGEVKETELENEGGSTVYEVEVIGKDGKLREVTWTQVTAKSSVRSPKRTTTAPTITAPKTPSSRRSG